MTPQELEWAHANKIDQDIHLAKGSLEKYMLAVTVHVSFKLDGDVKYFSKLSS